MVGGRFNAGTRMGRFIARCVVNAWCSSEQMTAEALLVFPLESVLLGISE